MFQGFSQETVDFMWGIRFNNERSWFEAHKQEYLTYFLGPMKELGAQVRDALLWGAGARPEPARRREEAKAAAQALSPRQLSQLADKLEQLRSACGFNVGTGHLAGWLCAAASSL